MQSKRNHEAESEEENELKPSNQFDGDRQGKLNNWETTKDIFSAGKFLNYWMTRTVTTTAYSYTVSLSFPPDILFWSVSTIVFTR